MTHNKVNEVKLIFDDFYVASHINQKKHLKFIEYYNLYKVI